MLNFTKHSGVYTLETQQELKMSITEAWRFFNAPENLQKITPTYMGFKITSAVNTGNYPGKIITYTIGIFPFFKTNWVTEITQVSEQSYFIDEQRFGPYKMWHHEHWFYKLANGNTLMVDKVIYKVPYGILGQCVHGVFIKKQLRSIFEYRYRTLEKLFNE